MSEPAIQITGLRKNYGALRPLRIASLAVAPGERVAIGGIDAAGAELMVNLVTGASLPDAS
jgi:ABC-type branched-subunit amino acid transport system ATPase component